MPTFFNKTVMIFCLCLIFIGQSTSSMTLFYGMIGMSSMTNGSTIQSSHNDMSEATDNTHHMMSMSDCSEKNVVHSPDTPTEECCAQECDCLISGCSTVSAFLALFTYPTNTVIANKIAATTELLTSQTFTSLYRPPILS